VIACVCVCVCVYVCVGAKVIVIVVVSVHVMIGVCRIDVIVHHCGCWRDYGCGCWRDGMPQVARSTSSSSCQGKLLLLLLLVTKLRQLRCNIQGRSDVSNLLLWLLLLM